MNKLVRIRNFLMLALACVSAACSPPPPERSDQDYKYHAEGRRPDVIVTPPAGRVTADGNISAIDLRLSTITINHEPIPALGWPAMSMRFDVADPALLEGMAEGERVRFELSSGPGARTIVRIEKLYVAGADARNE